MAVIYKNVLVDPSGPGCIWSDDRVDCSRQTSLDLLHVLQDTRSSPIEIRPIFKHDEDVGISEHRLCSYGFDMRGCEQSRDNRVGDLIFDNTGWFTHPGCMNNHFDVGNIRQRIERNSPQRPDSREYK